MTTIALEQMQLPAGRVEDNTVRILQRVRSAGTDGCDFVVLPELANTGYIVDRDQVRRFAEPDDGPFVTAMVDALQGTTALAFVGMCERDGDSFFNTVLAVGASGPVMKYRKVHLFDLERAVYEAGEELPLLSTGDFTVGVCVCYDLRFVEVMRSLSLRGADLLIAPAAWVTGFDAAAPAEGLVQQANAVVVQANLNQLTTVAVSQVGDSADGVRMLGSSVAVNAKGELLAGPLSRTAEASVRVSLDVSAERAAQVRGPRIRPRQDRRTDIYSVSYQGESL